MLGKLKRAPTGILLLLLGIFAVVTIYSEFQKTCCAPKPEDKKSPTSFSANLNGYYMTCVSNETISKSMNGSWEEVGEMLPKSQGGYYLDGEFVDFVPDNYLGCDYLSCIELPKPYQAELIEHKKIGDKPPPLNISKAALTVPVYETAALSGEIKIDVDYYGDKNCSDKKTFSITVNK